MCSTLLRYKLVFTGVCFTRAFCYLVIQAILRVRSSAKEKGARDAHPFTMGQCLTSIQNLTHKLLARTRRLRLVEEPEWRRLPLVLQCRDRHAVFRFFLWRL
jgi:hypothetical protein